MTNLPRHQEGVGMVHTPRMTAVQFTCENCGEVRVPVKEVLLYLDRSKVEFVCPFCRVRDARVAPERIMLQLKAAGAPVWVVPEPLTIDDVLDFHERFEEEIRGLMSS